MSSEPIIDDRAVDDDVERDERDSPRDDLAPALEQSEGEEEVASPRRRGPEVHSLPELMAALPVWARQNAELLRSHLTGVVALVTTDPHRVHSIDWSGEKLVVRAGEAEESDCRVSLSQADLMRVVKGELNPQIGMLSGRIRASGNPEMAMYLFNLLVRR